MCANVTCVNNSQIYRNIAETKRLMRLSLYQRINERAADRKADAWLHYQPLTRAQLQDRDVDEYAVIISRSADPRPDRRSTHRSAARLKQFIVVKRPTETRAIMRANSIPVLDQDFERLPIESGSRQPPALLRWCIWCKTRHPKSAFIHHKRYSNGLSWACKAAIQERKRARWGLVA